MRIALDATFSTGRELSGVGVYCRRILFGLAAAYPETRFDFCYRPHRWTRSWDESLPRNARRQLLWDWWPASRATLFHGLNQRLPHTRFRRAVTTFHDLFVLTGEYSTAEFRRRFAAQARHAASAADGILAVSAFTAGQVADLLGVDRERIWVVPHGADAPAAVTPPEQREPILLFVGVLQKRKNVVRLVDAFRAAPSGWKLVLVGGQGYGAGEILDRIAASPCRDRILVTGYVSAAELHGWYQRAAALVFPSLDEGFGIPVLEAMANGLPVVASRTSALPEVMGDAGVPVDPHRTESIAEGIRRITGDPELRAKLAQRGRRRATAFTWEKAVENTWAAYQAVAG